MAMYGGIYIVKYMNQGEIFKTHKWRETDKTHGEERKIEDKKTNKNTKHFSKENQSTFFVQASSS